MACKLSDIAADRSDQSYLDDKRGASQDEFVLERVQGLTSTALHSLASNPITGWVAFPAACVLVLLDPKTNEQKFIESPSLRNISCCAFTDDGRFVAFSETGMKPHIAMWNLREHKECHKFVTDTTVRAIFFHPTSPILISLGLKENLIVVWDYVKGMRMASCKWQTMPLSVAIPRTGSSLVVCGHRKITLFNISKVDSRSYETNVFQDRRTVLLGKQSEYTFVDVESGRGKHERTVYTVTSCGYLCEIKLGDILIDKAIKVDTQTFCVRYNTELLFVGCPAGVVKICDPDNLTVTAAVSLSNLLGPSAMPKVGNKGFLDVCTLVVDENEKIVTCVYADCSMHSWQIGTDGQKIVCSAIEPGVGANGVSGHPASKSNLLRAFIGCCEKAKTNSDLLGKCSVMEQTKPPPQYGGRRLVNENRASYNNVNAVRFTPDGKDVICGNEEGEIKVYELSTGILRRVIEAHSSQVTCIELMYDEDFQLVCSGGRDRVMFVLNARNDFSLVQVLCDHSAAITAISLVNHKGVLTLVSAAADNVILIRRAILGGTLRFTITGEIAQTNCSRSFFVTSDYIALGGRDSQIKVFKADPVFVSKPVKTINCQKLSPTNAGFKAIDIDPSSSFMAVSQSNGNISVYHLQTGQPVASLPLQSDITNIQFTSDLKYMVSSTSNGCDLVWRLPERMTEFMRSKQEKTYQIETNKEVTYETYMSCVKVCKEETEEEDDMFCPKGGKEDEKEDELTDQQDHESRHEMRRAFQHQRRRSSSSRNRGKHNPGAHRLGEEGLHRGHIAQNSSNHNSEWDRTPSIDSMSILDNYNSPVMLAGKARGERDVGGVRSCSSCCSESILNCSTCTHSVSTTTHTSCCSAAQTESSTSAREGRAGGSHQLRFYCGTDHELFGQVIEEGRCIKVGPFREGLSADMDNSAAAGMRQSAKGTNQECEDNMINNNVSIEPLRESTTGADKQNGKPNGGKNEMILEGLTEKDATGTERSLTEKLEVKTEEVFGIKTGEEVDTFNTSVTFREHRTIANLRLESTQNVSQNSEITEFIAPPVHESRYPKSKKILEKALFYEGVMRGEVMSARRPHPTSPTRQYTEAVAEAVRSQSQRRNDTLRESSIAEAGLGAKNNCCAEPSKEAEEALHWTPLTTPDYSNTSSNITNLVPCSSSTLIDLCNTSKLVKDIEAPPGHGQETEENAEGGGSTELIDSEDQTLQPEEERKLDCDTTQDDGESIRSEFVGDVMSSVTEPHDQKGCDSDTCGEICCAAEEDNQILDLSLNLGKIDLNSEADKACGLITESPIDCEKGVYENSNCLQSADKPELSTPGTELDRDAVLAYLTSGRAKEIVLGQDDDGAVKRQSVLEQLEQEGFTVPEKYHSALRSCMQLSNSQETFATLRVDTNDLELMAFLSHALKKKLLAAGLVGLSCNEIDSLLNTDVTPSEASQASSTDAAAVKPTARVCSDTGDTAKKALHNSDSSCPPTARVPRPECHRQEKCDIGDHPKRGDDSNPYGAASVKENNGALDETGNSGKAPSTAQGKPDPQSVRRSKSPLGEAKRRMYKSILSKLSCARKGNNRSWNRSNAESELEQDVESKIRELIQASMRGEEFNDLLHSDTYLKMESSKEDLVVLTSEGWSKRPAFDVQNSECLNSRVVTNHASPNQGCKAHAQATRSSNAARAGSSPHNVRTVGSSQGRTSSKHSSVRVNSPASCDSQSETGILETCETKGDRSTHSYATSELSAACVSQKESEESVQSKTESFLSAISRGKGLS